MTQLVLGFWGVGVTTLVKRINDAGGKAIESRDYPIDVHEIQKQQDAGFTVFGYINRDVIQTLENEEMEFTLVYPALFCKDEYITRLVKKGANLSFVDLASKRWVPDICWISSITGHPSICLGKGEFIPDLDDPRYRAVPFPKE